MRAFLDEADDAARRLGRDANHLGTAFGPTNVSIHRVATAIDLGDVQVAIDLGPRVDTTGLPVERQVRHALGTARALSARNRTDNTLATVLAAKQKAPEQVRHHAISRQLVQTWMRRGRSGRPGRRHRHHCRARAAGPRQPPVLIQVRSGAQIGSPIVTQLHGVMTAHGAEQGLLVAWGGLTKPGRDALKNQHLRVRVWETADMVDAVLRTYDRLPDDIRAQLPLRRVDALRRGL